MVFDDDDDSNDDNVDDDSNNYYISALEDTLKVMMQTFYLQLI